MATSPTLFKFFMMLLLVIGCFSGLMLFYLNGVTHSAYPVSAEMNRSYQNITGEIAVMNRLSESVRDKSTELGESTDASSLVATITGFTNVINLFKSMIDVGFGVIGYMMINMLGATIPAWASAILLITVIIFVVIALLKAVSGRNEI